jgi:very-long-chain ceramide synthase
MSLFDQDLAFVAYYIVVFSFIRQSLFFYVLQPLARSYGIQQEEKVERFAEQGYDAIYFTCSGSLGLVRSTYQGFRVHY